MENRNKNQLAKIDLSTKNDKKLRNEAIEKVPAKCLTKTMIFDNATAHVLIQIKTRTAAKRIVASDRGEHLQRIVSYE